MKIHLLGFIDDKKYYANDKGNEINIMQLSADALKTSFVEGKLEKSNVDSTFHTENTLKAVSHFLNKTTII